MSFLPLTLGVGTKPGAEGKGPKPLSKVLFEQTLKNDDFTCRFCGFRSLQYQRAIPYDGDYVTACSFCEQVLSLERAGLLGGGVLIWLPEITQAELHHIVRAIYVAKSEEGSEAAELAARAFDALMARRTDAKKRLGSDDPLLLATVLHENLSDKERPAAIAKLEGIRLLPLDKYMMQTKGGGSVNAFPQIVKFWQSAKGPFGPFPAPDWITMFKKLAA